MWQSLANTAFIALNVKAQSSVIMQTTMELALFPLRFVLLTKSQETEADFEAQKRNASNRRKIVDIMTYIIYKPKSHLELQSR